MKKKLLTYLVVILFSILYVVLVLNLLKMAPKEPDFNVVEIVVSPGDTAWRLVEKNNGPNTHTGEGVYYFKKLNGSVELKPGQVVLVPVF